MNRVGFNLISAATIICALYSSPVIAGEAVRYEAAPAWVNTVSLATIAKEDSPSELVNDWQYRMEKGVVHAFFDRVVRLDNASLVTNNGTVSFSWSPDKGDLIIHKLEIIRGKKIIDLVKEGLRFEVIRREENLERRLLDGRLTATVSVPGLEVGDILRVSQSTTIADQALGEEMQVTQFLPSAPRRIGFGRVMISWPIADKIKWHTSSAVSVDGPTEQGGYRYISKMLPLAKSEDMPEDAPSRYSAPAILRVSSYQNWGELSRLLHPHFEQASALVKGGAVEQQAQKIMRQAKGQKERAALATILVQDQISYLLNGMDGGNYLPQKAEETWEKRYGDCKAKSVLLHAMLRYMGIDSEVVLVASQGGDILPHLLPMPGNFDHMIVRAKIDGTDYWLDGTSTAARVDTLEAVPPFFHALPLTETGSELVSMDSRDKALPDMEIALKYNQSGGIDMPSLFTLKATFRGPTSAQIEKFVLENDDYALNKVAASFAENWVTGAAIASRELFYDKEKAIGTIKITGVSTSQFEYRDGKNILDVPSPTKGTKFAPNRVRSSWRNIPVATSGPFLLHYDFQFELPSLGKDGGASAYQVRGKPDFEISYANTHVSRKSQLSGSKFSVTESTANQPGEVAVDAIPAARLSAQKVAKANVSLEAPTELKWRWEVSAQELQTRTKPVADALSKAIEIAEKDDTTALSSRASYHTDVFNFAAAAQDYTKIIDIEPSAEVLLARAQVNVALGKLDEAVKDAEAAYTLDTDNNTAFYQASLMARAGQGKQALELLNALPTDDNDEEDFASTLAQVKALTGDVEGGYQALKSGLDKRSDSSELLNALCWYQGLNKKALEDALEVCTKAVERSVNSADALDSRAMVHYRLGHLDEALKDLTAALKLSPNSANSRYVKGIILAEKGDKMGHVLIEQAMRQAPDLKEYFAPFGLEPK